MNKYLFTTIIALMFSVSILSQNSNQVLVQNKYPKVYESIVQLADSRWGGDEAAVSKMIESQTSAFLDIAEAKQELDAEALIMSIMDNSLPGHYEHNRNILNDESIDNPFTQLMCNWYFVKEGYSAKTNTKFSTAPVIINTPSDAKNTATYYTQSEQETIIHPNQNKVNRTVYLGFRAGYGFASLTNLSKYFDLKSSSLIDYALILNGRMNKFLFFKQMHWWM